MFFSEGRGLSPITKWPQMDVVSTPCDKAVQISANASELRTTAKMENIHRSYTESVSKGRHWREVPLRIKAIQNVLLPLIYIVHDFV